MGHQRRVEAVCHLCAQLILTAGFAKDCSVDGEERPTMAFEKWTIAQAIREIAPASNCFRILRPHAGGKTGVQPSVGTFGSRGALPAQD